MSRPDNIISIPTVPNWIPDPEQNIRVDQNLQKIIPTDTVDSS